MGVDRLLVSTSTKTGAMSVRVYLMRFDTFGHLRIADVVQELKDELKEANDQRNPGVAHLLGLI
ncbi:hypothetical protein MJO28_005051 [Puccinia striiformis f. sp. tritici]|uniref:Uncharacterized protein n=1 Tax=Puccinia striiformis f. sp. tritici TaxID=168172 RepID=A0ACC0EL53_9BASI|nr:hypothetical protein MJO28_005051 [Puccinia striiformis f. sp. tritici]